MVQIQGSKFTLRQWRQGDEIALVKYANNANVLRYLSDRFHYPYIAGDADNWINFQVSRTETDNLAIDIKGEVVGGIGIDFRTDIFRKTAVLGYWLGEPFWGQGIMSEAVELFCNYCFDTFDLARIQAGTFDCNPASMQVLLNVGFVKEGIAKNALFKHGRLYDEHVFALTK